MNWQPIETAPRDGRAVILCWAIDADGGPIDWTENMQTAGVFVQVASWSESALWWALYTDDSMDIVMHFDPTHWMPLPLPPCKEAKP